MTFTYVYRNNGQGSHAIVPLVQTGRRIQHNMKVADASGRQLVFLDSETCRLAALAHARTLRDEAERILASVVGRELKVVNDIDLNSAYSSATMGDPNAVIQAVERSKAAAYNIWAIFANKELQAQYEKVRSPPPQGANEFTSGREAAEKLLRFVTLRGATYQPFALLEKPVTAGDYVLLRHEIHTDSQPIYTERPSLVARIVARTIAGLRWLRERLLGRSTVELEFPIQTHMTSYHLRAIPADGVSLRKDLTPINFSTETFRGHHRGRDFAAQNDHGFHIYRRSRWIAEYEKQIERFPAPHLRDRLWFKLTFREVGGLTALFYLALVALFSTLIVAETPEARGALYGASAAAMLALVVQSLDRPFSQRLLSARVVAILIVAGAVVLLGPTVAPAVKLAWNSLATWLSSFV